MINFTKRVRSELWIYVNIDNIVTSYKFKELLSFNLGLSNNYWCKTRNNNYLLNLNDILLEQRVQNFLDYINGFIWLNLNNHIKDYFIDNNILDYCVATDFNFNFDDGARTMVGEAEFSLKYRRTEINDVEAEYYGNILVDKIKECHDILPINKNDSYFTTIPLGIDENENNKLSFKLVKRLSYILNNNLFILKCHKPSFKDKTLNEKINIWNEIYSDASKIVFVNKVDIKDKDVIIIDDLYQSGVSMWSYAKFLKSLGAKRVMGISAVKSLRDSDNTNV
ncbi:hypothetical protein [Brachyspira alvinipulli]|uniref:hypothetical protein n=1 Tax=Brachyspira alvinipulli TaxID=84379 RepID=UPI0004802B12|nr:hypothetical protein [Brachyspira alvinipulli]